MFFCFQKSTSNPYKCLVPHHYENNSTRKKIPFYVYVQSAHLYQRRQQFCGGKMWFLKNLSYIFSLDPYLSNISFYAYSSGNKGYETSLYHLLLPVDLPWFMLLKILFPIYNFQTFIFLSVPFIFVICFLVCLFCCCCFL